MNLYLNIEDLMKTRGIVHKMVLDTAEHRTADELGQLSDFLEWLHAFQEAAADGETSVTVHLG